MHILPHDNIAHLPTQLPGGDYHVRVPDDMYVVEYVGAEGFHYFGDLRVVLWFIIIEGEFSGEMLPAYYNVQRHGTVPKGRFRSPKFAVGQKSRLARDLGTLFPDQFSPSNLPSSIPENDMKHGAILVETGTIDKDPEGFPRSEAFHSSKIVRIVGWADQS